MITVVPLHSSLGREQDTVFREKKGWRMQWGKEIKAGMGKANKVVAS